MISKAINLHWYKQAIEMAIVTDNFSLAEKYHETLTSQAKTEKNEQLLATCEKLKRKIEKGQEYVVFDQLTDRANSKLSKRNYEEAKALYEKAKESLENSSRSEVNKNQYLEYINSRIRIITQQFSKII